MRYRQFEAALVEIFGISDKGRCALRGRIRNLQSMGVPATPKPGSGERVEYTKEHLLHVAIAIQFELGGQPPRRAADYANQVLAIHEKAMAYISLSAGEVGIDALLPTACQHTLGIAVLRRSVDEAHARAAHC